jgi:alcohol dehydrogenase
MLAQFSIPPLIVVGAGASKEVGFQAKRLHANRALVVCGQYIEQSGLARRTCDLLEKEGIATSIFSGVQPEPIDLNVLDGFRHFQEFKADLVVGLGGGSSLDVAKVISILANNELPIFQYAGFNKVPNPGVPRILIPTTSGSGSENTKTAVITDTEQNIKFVIFDANLLSTVSLVDYELTLTLPPQITASAGMDTVAHGIESYVAKKAGPITDPVALSSLRYAAENLYLAYKEPENKKAREGMTLASTQAGMVSTNSAMTLVHGMARPIGALYHAPHGLSNAILLPWVTEYSISGAPERYATIARNMAFASEKDPDEAAGLSLVNGLKELNKKLRIPSLGECVKVNLEVFDQNVEKMATDALASGSPQNNPVVPDVQEIVELYHKAW